MEFWLCFASAAIYFWAPVQKQTQGWGFGVYAQTTRLTLYLVSRGQHHDLQQRNIGPHHSQQNAVRQRLFLFAEDRHCHGGHQQQTLSQGVKKLREKWERGLAKPTSVTDGRKKAEWTLQRSKFNSRGHCTTAARPLPCTLHYQQTTLPAIS